MKVIEFIIAGILCVVCILVMRCGSIKAVVEKPVKIIVKVGSNKHVQRYGAPTCWIASRIFDATADACIFSTTNPIYGARKDSWHAYKINALVLTMVGFWLKGMEIGQGHTTPIESTKRFLFGTAPISYVIWQWQYHSVRYDKPFDYSPDHNPHRYMFPSFWGDKYTVVKPYQMVSIDLILLSTGIYGLIKY